MFLPILLLLGRRKKSAVSLRGALAIAGAASSGGLPSVS
jgi:hypothetical protein